MTALLRAPAAESAQASARSSARSARSDRSVIGVVAFAIALLPLLHPKGPGHFAPADVAMAAAIVFTLMWAAWTRTRMIVPFAFPVAIMVVAGAVAALGGIAPTAGLQAIIQDLFLLSWGAAVASVCRTPRAIATLLRTWSWSATAWALVLVGARLGGYPAIAGVHRGMEGGRAQGTLDHPNMAGSYFAVSLMVVLIGRSPKHPVARAACCLLIAWALFYTGSNAAILGLPIAGMAGLFLVVRRRSGAVAAIGVTMLVALSVGMVGYEVNQAVVSHVENSDNRFVQDSVGRSSRSGAGRQALFSEEIKLARTGPVLGRGPASTKASLGKNSSSTVKEAHDDFLATLTERGAIGVVGLVLLGGAIAIRAFGILPGRLRPAFALALPGSIAMVSLLVLLAVTSSVHEILHYRHLWALLGILGGVYHFGRLPAPSKNEVMS